MAETNNIFIGWSGDYSKAAAKAPSRKQISK